MPEPNPSRDDEAFLDDLVERAMTARAQGRALDVGEVLQGRDHLRRRVDQLLGIAGELAPVTAPRLRAARPAIAGYTILAEAGRGGMGIVYRARHAALGRVVALKVLAPALTASPRSRERFLREARALARLQHPGVVTVFDVVETPACCAYAMEWIDGPTLLGYLDRGSGAPVPAPTGPVLAPEAAAQVGIAVAQALAAVHAAGLVHRDVKPGNILLRADGTPLLADFGLVQDQADSMHTADGQFVGTVAYAAPEQLRGEHALVGPWTDVYGLGATLYHALAGDVPFRASSPTEFLRRVAEGQWTPLRRRNRRVPRDLATIVERAMAPEPAHRYATAEALGADLARFLRHEAILARPAGLALRLLRWGERRPQLALALCALLVSLLVGLVVSLSALGIARSERAAAARREYTAAIGAAEAALRAHDVTSARAFLEEAPAEHRHWEWHYLHGRLDQSLTMGRHRARIRALARHPQGALVASAGDDHTARIWDVATGTQLRVLDHRGQVHAVAWSHDGRLLAMGGTAELALWDPHAGTLLARLACTAVQALAFAPDDQVLAVGDGRPSIRLFQVAALRSGTVPRGAAATAPPAPTVVIPVRNEVHELRFSARGWLAGSSMGGARVFDPVTGFEVALLRVPATNTFGLAVHPDGNQLALGCGDGTVRCFAVAEERETGVFRGHQGRVMAVAWNAAGTQLATAGLDRTVRLWNADGRELAVFRGHRDMVRDVDFASGDFLVSAGGDPDDGTVQRWRARQDDEAQQVDTGHHAVHVAVDPGGQWLVCVSGSKTNQYASLGDLRGRRLLGQRVRVQPREVPLPFAVSMDGARLALGGDGVELFAGRDLAARVGGTEPDLPRAVVQLPTGRCGALAFVGDDRHLAVGGMTGTVSVWDATTRQPLRHFQLQGGPVTDAAADGTGQLLAAATRTHVALWDARSGATLHAWNDLARVGSLALSADGQWLAIAHESAGHAAVIRVWDCRAGREHLVLRGHTDHITWLAFSPDSRRLASASYDRTVRLWEPVTGMPAATLFDHGYRVTSVAWSGDGAWLVSGAGDGLVRFRCAAGLR